MEIKNIERKLVFNLSPSQVFECFVHNFDNWWPKEYTWSQKDLHRIYIKPHVQGKCTEIGPLDFRIDWGTVLEYSENEFISFAWQISSAREPIPNHNMASVISVKLEEKSSEETFFIFSHKNFSNHQKDPEKYREMMDSENGWDFILTRFKDYVLSNNS